MWLDIGRHSRTLYNISFVVAAFCILCLMNIQIRANYHRRTIILTGDFIERGHTLATGKNNAEAILKLWTF